MGEREEGKGKGREEEDGMGQMQETGRDFRRNSGSGGVRWKSNWEEERRDRGKEKGDRGLRRDKDGRRKQR